MEPGIISNILQAYGPWGVVSLFAIAIVVLWGALQRERKHRDADVRGYNLQIIQMVKEAAEREANFSSTVRTVISAVRGLNQ